MHRLPAAPDYLVMPHIAQIVYTSVWVWAAGIVERLCPELVGHRHMGTVTKWPFAGSLADPRFWRRASARSALRAGGTPGRVRPNLDTLPPLMIQASELVM